MGPRLTRELLSLFDQNLVRCSGTKWTIIIVSKQILKTFEFDFDSIMQVRDCQFLYQYLSATECTFASSGVIR